MTFDLLIPLLGVAFLTSIILAAIALRIPAWNPVYLVAVGFGTQIVAALILGEQVNYSCDPRFWASLVGADCLCVGILFLLSMKYLRVVKSRRTLEGVFSRIHLSKDRRIALHLALAAMACLQLAVTGYLTIKWKAPPVVAMRQHGAEIAEEENRDDLVAISTYGPFTVPFFGIIADATVSVPVVIYFLLLADSRNRARRLPLTATLSLLAVAACASVHVQRNSIVGGLLAALYLSYLTGLARVRHLALGAIVILVYLAAMAEFRHGEEGHGTGFEMPALMQIPIVGKLIETPLVYLGTGPLNFNAFWNYSDVRGHGNLFVSNSLPGFLEPIFDIERYDVVGYFLDEDLFVLHGQTLRTGWFDFYFDFDLIGLFTAAIVFPLLVFFLYYQTLARPGSSPSMMFFVLARPICLFPLINLFFSMTAWSAIVAGLFVDWVLRGSVSDVATADDFDGLAAPIHSVT